MSSQAQLLNAQLDHVAIVTFELERVCTLLRDVVGLEVGPRPAFGGPGHWLYSNGKAVIHLIGATESAYTGVLVQPRIDHVALRLARGEELHALVGRLKRRGLPYAVGQAALTGETQLFMNLAPGLQLEFTLAQAASNGAELDSQLT